RELQRPRLARVHGLVDSRGAAGADAQNVGRALADGIDVTEIQAVGCRTRDLRPRLAAVLGAEDRVARAARPRHFLRHGADASETGGDVGLLRGPRRAGP